jgi:hypothetical protein
MGAPRHDTGTQAMWTVADEDLAAGPVRATDVEALLSGHIDLLELTERAWVRCGLRSPGPALAPAAV